MKPLSQLLGLALQLSFEEYHSGELVDGQGQFQWRPPGDFPLVIMPTSFSARQQDRPLTWHEYLEIFVPLEGYCQVQVGRSMVELSTGDLLVMDNLKLHALRNFSGPRLRVIVIRFLPELIYSAGSLVIDHLFCVPFYHQVEGQPHVLRAGEEAAGRVHGAMSQLLECYFDPAGPPYSQGGAKVYFLEVLYHLSRRFHVSETLYSEYLLHRERSQRLRKLFDYTASHYADKITVSQAAALVGMSRRRFLGLFKTMADMTWVEYLNDVRLTNAARLVKQTTLPIADIAAQVGYTDQSYMNRRFKERFGHTPLEFRKQGLP
jgi:AraC-like DNA-binding protein/mannose-6-phosphate isomerase-like protein (cupin superfamily)